MTDVLRRKWYVESRVLIETARILNPQFKSTILEISGAELEILRNLMMYVNRESTFASGYFSRYYLSPTVNEWNSLLAIVADLEEKLMLIYVDDYVCVRDLKAAGVAGGTFTSGAWQIRDINDEQADPSGICVIDANRITLSAGTYRCCVVCPAFGVNQHQVRLYSVTSSTILLMGSSAYAQTTTPGTTTTRAVGSFTLAVASAIEV